MRNNFVEINGVWLNVNQINYVMPNYQRPQESIIIFHGDTMYPCSMPAEEIVKLIAQEK